jgi:hypothetical protein
MVIDLPQAVFEPADHGLARFELGKRSQTQTPFGSAVMQVNQR